MLAVGRARQRPHRPGDRAGRDPPRLHRRPASPVSVHAASTLPVPSWASAGSIARAPSGLSRSRAPTGRSSTPRRWARPRRGPRPSRAAGRVHPGDEHLARRRGHEPGRERALSAAGDLERRAERPPRGRLATRTALPVPALASHAATTSPPSVTTACACARSRRAGSRRPARTSPPAGAEAVEDRARHRSTPRRASRRGRRRRAGFAARALARAPRTAAEARALHGAPRRRRAPVPDEAQDAVGARTEAREEGRLGARPRSGRPAPVTRPPSVTVAARRRWAAFERLRQTTASRLCSPVQPDRDPVDVAGRASRARARRPAGRSAASRGASRRGARHRARGPSRPRCVRARRPRRPARRPRRRASRPRGAVHEAPSAAPGRPAAQRTAAAAGSRQAGRSHRPGTYAERGGCDALLQSALRWRAAPSIRSSPSPTSSSRCSSAGASATSSTSRCAAARAPSRGSSTRARRPPTAGPASHHVLRARLQGHLPALQDDARLLRRAQGRLGLPRAAGRDRRRAAARASQSKEEIEAYGIAEFNAQCRESVFEFLEDWNALTERIGFWLDLDDAYRTLDADVRRVGLVGAASRSPTRACSTRATRSCPTARAAARRCPVARGRAGLPGRRSTRRVYVRFPVAEDGGPLQAGDELLVWTTTPWTLVSNAAVAVDPELTYVRAKTGALDAPVVLAEALVERVLGDGRRADPRPLPGRGARRRALRAAVPVHRRRRVRRARPHRPARRLRHRRRRHRPRAHGDRLRRGRLPPRRSSTA